MCDLAATTCWKRGHCSCTGPLLCSCASASAFLLDDVKLVRQRRPMRPRRLPRQAPCSTSCFALRAPRKRALGSTSHTSSETILRLVAQKQTQHYNSTMA